MTTLAGGCQCGRVRYSVAVDGPGAYLCHCDMCKRATGGVSIAFKLVRFADVAWTAAEPDWYRSSPIAHRPFCARCGTPLGFRYLEGSENMDLTVGSFDDPHYFVPTSHFAVDRALAAWLDTSHLPGKTLAEHAPLMERWDAAGGMPG